MRKSVKGVFSTLCLFENKMDFAFLPETNHQPVNTIEAEIYELPKVVRSHFVRDVLKSIGDIQDGCVPVELIPLLNRLVHSAESYVSDGDDKRFVRWCTQAMETSKLGWGYFSFWVCSEQSRCYSLYWGLKLALDTHYEQLATLRNGSKNDGCPKNDKEIPPTPPEPTACHLKGYALALNAYAVGHAIVATAKRIWYHH